jgi:hypothetical protein
MKSKWFYSRVGDADCTGGRGQGIIPLQDEKGWVIGPIIQKGGISPPIPSETSPSPTADEVRWQRRRSKRDSGIMLMSPHLSTFNSHDRRDSTSNIENSSQNLEPYQKPKFDFERMERNLDKVEKLMEQNAQQMRSLEHVQAANMERLTSALVQNVEMIRELAKGQGKLGDIVEELRSVVKKEEKTDGKRPGILKKKSSKAESLKNAKAANSVEISKPEIAKEPLLTTSKKDECNHVVRRPPRKVGRTVVGYIYADDDKSGSKKE